MGTSLLPDLKASDRPKNGQKPTSGAEAQTAASETHPGGFFAIDSRIWAKVTAYGMNEAVAYLVLACGTGHGNRTTKWSTNAVMKNGGIGWERAKAAIERLIAGGFIRHAAKYTKSNPRYELASCSELLEHEIAKNPTMPQNISKPEPRPGSMLLNASENLIWLPNSLVTGTSSGEESPVSRLKSAGCIRTLRLFVDLYASQNLRDDGGISPVIVRQPCEREQLGYFAGYMMWGFVGECVTHSWLGPFASHKDSFGYGEDDDCPMSEEIELLERMGLLSFVPHIFENDTDTAEPLHAFGIGKIGEDPIEKRIGDAANQAACFRILPKRLAKAREDGFDHFCPIRETNPTAQMIGVARLTYRPHTKRTAAWFAELQKTAPTWIETFNKLAAVGGKAVLQRDAKCA
jgi:hypothetical protein